MTTERTKWWKAFLPKRKTGGPKDTDFDPFAERQKESKNPGDQSALSQQASHNSSSLFSGETYDDSHLESVFNEQTCRRNMKVSRSGRFKVKKKIRESLPIEDTENGAPGKDDMR